MKWEDQISEKPHFSFVERYIEAYINQFEAFFNSVENNLPSAVLIEDARWAVKLAIAAKQSLKENKPVSIKSLELEMSV